MEEDIANHSLYLWSLNDLDKEPKEEIKLPEPIRNWHFGDHLYILTVKEFRVYVQHKGKFYLYHCILVEDEQYNDFCLVKTEGQVYEPFTKTASSTQIIMLDSAARSVTCYNFINLAQKTRSTNYSKRNALKLQQPLTGLIGAVAN